MQIELADINQLLAYELVDTGDLGRIERFGDYTIYRPSTLAVWESSLPKEVKNSVDFFYDAKGSWKSKSKIPSEWVVALDDLKVSVSLQDNGQVGVFPEHVSYFQFLKKIKENSPEQKQFKVLNLFAYTGLASLWLCSLGAEVTHVEISKRIITWAKSNLLLNPQLSSSVRFIPEDALQFVQREIRRGNQYDLVIADPPNFSRVSKSQTWELDLVVTGFISDLITLLAENGQLILSNHSQALNSHTIENLIRQNLTGQKYDLNSKDLILSEKNRARDLFCGSVTCLSKY